MGKRGGKKGFGGRSGKKGRDPNYRFNAADFVREHEAFERYYNGLNIVPDDEKGVFWETMRRDLPNSFRFTGSKSHALAVQKRLKEYYIPEITAITHEGNAVEPPQSVPWYPDELAWSMTTPKNVIRRFPPFASFQKFLVAESEVGNISRQEVVSMIPPLLMDIKPGMTVLDMCAAPGSKSCQLMEMIHAGEEERMRQVSEKYNKSAPGASTVDPEDADGLLEDDGRTTGLLIANDSDYKRAHMLIHQMKRLNSPNLIVTNHDATMYPSIKLPSSSGSERGKAVKNRYLKFDRILADVPCSGDGTARKNMNVWKVWNPSNGLGLYITQVRILLRAIQMLKVGGRVVYSTCSMNPVENEAVISSAIDRCGGISKVNIVDCSHELPLLKRSPGLKRWNIMGKQGQLWNSWEEVEAQKEKEGPEGLGRLSEGMFPPTGENQDIPLERCIRVYPHQQDTGGFFITVLEKISDIKTRPEEPQKATQKAPVTAVVKEMEAQQPDQNGEQPAKIDALDEILPAQVAPTEEREKNASVAESTHRKAASPSASTKRGPDHLEEEPPMKRTKVDDGNPDATADTVGDRPVHFPPPGPDAGSTKHTANSAQPSDPSQPPKKRKPNQPFEEPFKYLDPNHEELVRVYDFYKISPKFPRDRFMVRNAEGKPAKTIYYTSVLARDILVENEGRGIKFVHCGVKMFVKQDVQRDHVCPWRIQTDGLTLLESWVDEGRIVTLKKKNTLWKLLIEMFPKVNDNGWRELGEIGEWARDIAMGCCVLRVEPTDAEDGLTERMVFPLWRSLYSLNLMLPKEERRAMLLRLFNDDSPVVNTTQKRDKAMASESATATEQEPAVANGADDDYDDVDEEEGGVSLNTAGTEEENAIQKENLALGQQEDEVMKARQSFVAVEDEGDQMNMTV